MQLFIKFLYGVIFASTIAVFGCGGDSNTDQTDSGYKVVLSPANLQLAPGTLGEFTLEVSSQGYEGSVSLAATGIPNSWRVKFLPSDVAVVKKNETTTVTVAVDATSETGTTTAKIAIEATSDMGAKDVSADVTVDPAFVAHEEGLRDNNVPLPSTPLGLSLISTTGTQHEALEFELHVFANQNMTKLAANDVVKQNAKIIRIDTYNRDGYFSQKLFMRASELGPVSVHIPAGVVDIGGQPNEQSNTVNLTIVNPPPASPDISFFITSTGGEDGGNFGGIAGADQRCQDAANTAGHPAREWRAYLSADDDGTGAEVNARDRIGTGPWRNYYGTIIALDLDQLHTRQIRPFDMATETGIKLGGIRTDHDIVTGSDEDGLLKKGLTCQSWTSNLSADEHFLGHTDWIGNPPYITDQNWNSAHKTRCSAGSMKSSKGIGRIYCFAR